MLSNSTNRRDFLRLLGIGAAALAIPACARLGASKSEAKSPSKPLNFVFILIDDLGARDLGCYGGAFYETPNLDRLAAEGMRFTNAYAACPVCSPTRASILTGKYPARLHITDWIPGEQRSDRLLSVPILNDLPLPEETIAEALKPAGYRNGFIGKWHLGSKGHYPENQGFDVNLGGCHWGHPWHGYFSPYQIENLPDGPKGEYLTDRLATEAIRFIEESKKGPFFLYLCHYTVHEPISAKPEVIEKYKKKAAGLPPNPNPKFVKEGDKQNREYQDDPRYAAMVELMDTNVGRVLEKLKELKIADHTAIIFMSDNGGLSTAGSRPTSNRPLRAGKGWLYEGGIREPMIIKWPGVTKPGSTCSEPVTSTDFYPTMLEMAGLPPKPAQHMDGVSLVPLLKGTAATLSRPALYWHYPHYHGSGHRPAGAVRAGDFKLIEFYEDMRVELYNIKEDTREERELSSKMPETRDKLRKMLHEWRDRVGAEMPKPNPNFRDKSEAKTPSACFFPAPGVGGSLKMRPAQSRGPESA